MEKEQIKIIIDRRESKEHHNLLLEHGAIIDSKTLSVGDYILSNRLVAERKSRTDFENSILDSRLFEQATRLKGAYERCIIIVEGKTDSSRLNRTALLGAYTSLIADFGITLFFTRDPRSTTQLLYSLARYEQKSNKRPISIVSKPKLTSLTQAQEVLVCSIPNMGPKKARLLLDYFGSPINLFCATDQQLLKVPGIGEKQVKFIKSVLYSVYNSKNK
jgi:ERCC4-type nuclease